MTMNLTKPTPALDYERELISHHLEQGVFRPEIAAAMTIGLDRITAELERRENALTVQEHDMDPLDKHFAHLAPGHPGA